MPYTFDNSKISALKKVCAKLKHLTKAHGPAKDHFQMKI